MGMTRQLIMISVLTLLVTEASAYDFAAENSDGIVIYYNYINDGKELEVTKERINGQYSGVVIIPETVTYMGKSRQVTSIGKEAFIGCENLTAVSLPNSVKTIKEMAFFDNQGLTSLSLGNSVENIESFAFYRCLNIETLVLPNSVLSIGSAAFSSCTGIVNLTLSNNLKTIDSYAFNACRKIESLTLTSSIITIGKGAFGGTNPIAVKSFIKEPFEIEDDTFSNNTFYNVTLIVPEGSKDIYRDLAGWKRFSDIVEFNASDDSQVCATPTISYHDGKLIFNTSTEGARFVSTITNNDIRTYVSSEVALSATYIVSVFAEKPGYQDSDVATATLCWLNADPKTEGMENNIEAVRGRATLIASKNGFIDITGVANNTIISVYSINGQLINSIRTKGSQASIAVNLRKDDIAIVKIGDESVKIKIQ